MNEVFIVYECDFNGCSVLSVYTTQELAEQGMTAWVEKQNIHETELHERFADDPDEPELELYTETFDAGGALVYEKGRHYKVSITVQPLDTPCMSSYEKWKQDQPPADAQA